MTNTAPFFKETMELLDKLTIIMCNNINNMYKENITPEQLKAMAYDSLVNLEQSQANLKAINQAITDFKPEGPEVNAKK